MKKSLLLSSVLLALSVGGLAGCNQDNADFKVGVCQFVRHEALDLATKGFKDALTKGMKAAGKTVSIEVKNASKDPSNCAIISNNFVSKKKDLIMANATPALTSAITSTHGTDIPVLGTSITEYASIVGKDDLSGGTGANVSGTSDLADLKQQAQMIVDNFPTANKIGILYCADETNSLYQVDNVKAKLKTLGKTVKTFSFSDVTTLQATLSSEADNLDVLYIPTDNTCAENTDVIDGICRSKNLPIVTGEAGICRGCGTFTLSIDYYRLGEITGEMALEILLEGKDIKTMPIRYDTEPTYMYNPVICSALNLTVPEGYVALS